MPEDGDNLFELKILRSAGVEKEIDDFIRKMRDMPEKVEPIEVFAAIRKWFATAAWSDAMMRIAQEWANAPEQEIENGERYPILEFNGAHYIVGPLNLAWRDFFIRILTSQVQQKFDNFDVSSQLGAMGKLPQRLKRQTVSLEEWFRE